MAKKILQLLAPTVDAYALHSVEDSSGETQFFFLQVIVWALVEEGGKQRIEGYTTMGIDECRSASSYKGFGGYQDDPIK